MYRPNGIHGCFFAAPDGILLGVEMCIRDSDSPVRKVSLDEDGICLDVEDEDTGFAATLFSYDLGCQNLDWLCKIHENILDMFEQA